MTTPLRRVLVDGGSGSGKTTIAHHLVTLWTRLCGEQVQLVSLDAFYPGWEGLAAASRMVVQDVLHPTRPGYRRWDWELGQPADWVPLDPHRPMVVEGCGSVTSDSAALAGLSVWIELDEATRKTRALARDGELFAPWWDLWAEQEAQHWRMDEPWRHCDVVISGTSL